MQLEIGSYCSGLYGCRVKTISLVHSHFHFYTFCLWPAAAGGVVVVVVAAACFHNGDFMYFCHKSICGMVHYIPN